MLCFFFWTSWYAFSIVTLFKVGSLVVCWMHWRTLTYHGCLDLMYQPANQIGAFCFAQKWQGLKLTLAEEGHKFTTHMPSSVYAITHDVMLTKKVPDVTPVLHSVMTSSESFREILLVQTEHSPAALLRVYSNNRRLCLKRDFLRVLLTLLMCFHNMCCTQLELCWKQSHLCQQ